MQYRIKPGRINAWQFMGTNLEEIQSIVGIHWVDVDAYRENFIWADEQWTDIPEGIVALVWVAPSHQWAGVKTGDYIVQDSEGDFYPCDRQIFEKKYEEIPSGGGVVTSDQMALRSVQQSSRFR